jgi:ABC-type branched-subunit amino acid transport system ATPase component
MTVYRALVTAENMAEMHDVIDSFREVYTMRREYTDVFESVEYTMEYLGLYDEWYNTWVNMVE